jgi:hypothetical protein
MKTHAAALTFEFVEVDRGGQVRITGSSPEAIAAVHEFLRFQISDHKTGDPVKLPSPNSQFPTPNSQFPIPNLQVSSPA